MWYEVQMQAEEAEAVAAEARRRANRAKTEVDMKIALTNRAS